MKILFITTVNFEKNGISTFILNNIKVLSGRNKIDVLVHNCVPIDMEKQLKESGARLITLESRNKHIVNYFINIVNIVKNNNYDVVHVNGNSCSMAIELLAAKVAGCKVRVAHSHNTTTDHPFLNKVIRPLFEWAVTARMACSEDAGKWLFRNKKFTIIKNGINIDSYKLNFNERQRIRKLYNIKNNDIILGLVGRFNKQKNQAFLINVIKCLGKNYKLMLVGTGYKFNEIKEAVNNAKLSNVILVGEVNDVRPYLFAMDYFVMPSLFEGLPFSLIEAQAAGLPCLVSDNVDKKVNLTKNVKFLNIASNTLWVNYINKHFSTNGFRKREKEIIKNQEKVKAGGYDFITNARSLENKLNKLVND